MNFFRSEEHLRKWEGYNEKKKGGIIATDDLMRLFSGPYFRRRRDPDYFSHMSAYLHDMINTLDTLNHAGPYWQMNRVEKFGMKMGRKAGLL